nr:MAG TPA: Maltoporin periplasmic N-terminal extension [Caudoviricetes sp.]
MKKLTVSIGSLGSAAAGDYVSFNIWQGKRLLLSDQIAGKHSGTFHREYDVDYIQGEPLRIESNAPAGCSVGVNVAPSDDAVADTKPSAVFNGVLSIKDNQIFMREAFISKSYLDDVMPKTLEQRVADLEKQLANTSQAAGAKIEIIETPSGDGVSMIARKSDGTIVCRISTLS